MDKLNMHSRDLTEQNVERIAELFPSVMTETRDADGTVVRAIDFDLLRQELSDHVVDGPRERYQLDWPGKREALFAANAPIAKTLRPVREESVDFDTTENLFIEGDNLDALKLLQESYLGKVKLIYIDPPYNTGNDFIYNDNFAESSREYLTRSLQVGEDGHRLVANTDSHGRFHSDWLSMMYPRLRLARSLLRDDGSLFVSCDFHESSGLRMLLDEIFGGTNLIGEFAWQHSIQPKGYTESVSVHHNVIFGYRRSEAFALRPLERTAEHNRNYRNPDGDPRGAWRAGDVRNALYRPNLRYELETPGGKTIAPPKNGWRWSKETMYEKIASGEIVFSSDESSITRKIYLDTLSGRAVESLWLGSEVGTTREAAAEVKELFDGEALFDTPKPTKLISRILWIAGVGDGDLVMDFFAGSGTTAEAAYRHAIQHGGSCPWILVQLPEVISVKSEAANQGYANIAQLSRERVRRAARKIGDDSAVAAAAMGFRTLRVDTTGAADVRRTPEALVCEQLDLDIESFKLDRSPEDLLFQVMLDWGLELSLSIRREAFANRDLFTVDAGALIACFDPTVTIDVVREIARREPLRAVFRDSGFESDADRINAEQVFREISPSTDVKVI